MLTIEKRRMSHNNVLIRSTHVNVQMTNLVSYFLFSKEKK